MQPVSVTLDYNDYESLKSDRLQYLGMKADFKKAVQVEVQNMVKMIEDTLRSPRLGDVYSAGPQQFLKLMDIAAQTAGVR